MKVFSLWTVWIVDIQHPFENHKPGQRASISLWHWRLKLAGSHRSVELQLCNSRSHRWNAWQATASSASDDRQSCESKLAFGIRAKEFGDKVGFSRPSPLTITSFWMFWIIWILKILCCLKRLKQLLDGGEGDSNSEDEVLLQGLLTAYHKMLIHEQRRYALHWLHWTHRVYLWRSWNCHKLKVSKHDVSRVFYQVSQAENTEGAGTVVEDGQTLHVFVMAFCTRGMKSLQMLAIKEKNKRRKHLTWLLHCVFSIFWYNLIWVSLSKQKQYRSFVLLSYFHIMHKFSISNF